MIHLACVACVAGLARGLVLSKPATDSRLAREPAAIINEAMGELEHLWPGGTEVMTAAMKEARENHERGIPLRKKLVSAMRDNRPFVFAAFGSSISAGHDNVFNQSWPFELERMLKMTFQQLGFDFELRQRAAGGYGEMPFAAGCMSRAGEVDALSWEFSTFKDAPCEGKHFLDEASQIPGQPVVFALASERLNFDSLSTPTEERKNARNRILRNGDDVAFGRNRTWVPNEWYFGTEFISESELQTWDSLDAVGSSLKASSDPIQYLRQTGAAAQFEAAGNGFYTVNVGAASPSVVTSPWYQVREKAFNINWHPGPLGHTLIASQVAHYILTELRTAVQKPDPERRGPGPTADNPLLGSGPGEGGGGLQCGHLRTQQCFTGLQPSRSDSGLATITSSEFARSADSRWRFQESVQAGNPSANLGSPVDKRMVWHGTKDSGELKFHVNVKGDGQVVLICGAPCGWWCKGPAGYVSALATRWWNGDTFKGLVNDQPRQAIVKNLTAAPRRRGSDLTFTVDGVLLSQGDLIMMHGELFGPHGRYCPKCQNVGEICQPVGSLERGKHTIGVRVAPRTLDEKNFPDLSVELLQLMVVG